MNEDPIAKKLESLSKRLEKRKQIKITFKIGDNKPHTIYFSVFDLAYRYTLNMLSTLMIYLRYINSFSINVEVVKGDHEGGEYDERI